MFLVTHICRYNQREQWGHDIVEDPAKWLASVQEYQNEEYFIVNVLEVSQEFADKWSGSLAGE